MLSIRLRTLAPICLLFTALCLPACKRETPAAAPAADPAPAAPAVAPAPVAATPEAPAAATPAADFDPNSVPESTATLPPFPFFKTPEGLKTTFSEKDRIINFDRAHMVAGNKIVAIEGKIVRDQFPLASADQRQYTALEFHRNYENAIRELGGVRISQTQYTNAVVDAFGGYDKVREHFYGICPGDYGCENHTYLIRQAGKEYWIQVSTGAVPLHGFVTVLEREGMKQSLGLLDAAAMKQAIDKDGRVALYINFDTDKATLRPDAQPTVAEIGKLLSGDPALKLSIEGHTDNTGTAAHNQELSTARARSVLGALVGLGVDPARLQSKGFGQDKPVADNASEDGRAKNRRVELVKL
ncbi:MAG: OmpA family protein [Xanthomonadaceae bacterium]|nr:OmpA family protein [Xanthomonadaceae bacterium]